MSAGDTSTFCTGRINAKAYCRIFALPIVTPSPIITPPSPVNSSVHGASSRIHQLQRHRLHAEQNYIQGQTIRGQKSMKSCSTRFTIGKNAAVIVGNREKELLEVSITWKNHNLQELIHGARFSRKPNIFNTEIEKTLTDFIPK